MAQLRAVQHHHPVAHNMVQLPVHDRQARPPYCYICSADRHPTYHYHNSSREIRIVQGSDRSETLPYMCTTCMKVHPAKPEDGDNVVVSDSQLHNLHIPPDHIREKLPPDPIHIDWVTVCNASIAELEYAWIRDYANQTRLVRILLSAGMEDLARGRTRDQIVESFMHFKLVVMDRQSERKPGIKNELVIATILNPPSLVWFKDNGPAPRNHVDRLPDIKELNSWIVFFNKQNGKDITPRFHRYGVRDGWSKNTEQKRVRVKKHIMSQWNGQEPILSRMHLNPAMRVRMGTAVTRHFRGELERFGQMNEVRI